MRKVGLLPGTFDPVHLGHVALAKAAMRARGLDEAWLVLNPQLAQQDSYKGGVAPFWQRLEMAKLAVLSEPWLKVYDGELAVEPHTWTTFEKLIRREELKAEFLLGADTFGRIDRWDEVESVVKNATFAVAQRGEAGGRELSVLRQRLGALAADLKVAEFSFEGFGDVSSSSVKAGLRSGVRPAGLNPRVFEYIVAHQLYRS